MTLVEERAIVLDGRHAPVVLSIDSHGGWQEDRLGFRVRVSPIEGTYRLFLDDIRFPPDENWLVCRNIEVAKGLLSLGIIEFASLDHDLGCCEACTQRELERSQREHCAMWDGNMAHCTHVGTGYDLCLWMAETSHWPMRPPVVHSMNTVGSSRMRGVIARYWKQP